MGKWSRFNISSVVLGFAFLYLPIVILIVFSFNISRTNAVWQGFTLDWYRVLMSGQFGTERRLSTEFLLQALQIRRWPCS